MHIYVGSRFFFIDYFDVLFDNSSGSRRWGTQRSKQMDFLTNRRFKFAISRDGHITGMFTPVKKCDMILISKKNYILIVQNSIFQRRYCNFIIIDSKFKTYLIKGIFCTFNSGKFNANWYNFWLSWHVSMNLVFL